jgi:hypothetical protein
MFGLSCNGPNKVAIRSDLRLGLRRLMMADGGTGGRACHGMTLADLMSRDSTDGGTLGGSSRLPGVANGSDCTATWQP